MREIVGCLDRRVELDAGQENPVLVICVDCGGGFGLVRMEHHIAPGAPRHGGTARNAVFYGDKAIDRSPCGTGTSARMAQLAATGRLSEGEAFVHESIIGSQFVGRIEGRATVGGLDAIIPSIEGWARVTGINTIFVDDRDPYWQGFQVADR